MPTTLEDHLIDALARAARGDQAAFAEVYDRTSARAFGVAIRVLRDRAQAEEVVQETYLQVWRQAADFDGTRGRVVTWITTITHRRAVDRVRQAQRQTDREHLDAVRSGRPSAPDVADQVVQSDESAQVRDAMAALTDKQREALHLTYVDGVTHREACARLDIPLGTFKSRVRDAVEALRGQMGEEER